jgi:hypothetical protein
VTSTERNAHYAEVAAHHAIAADAHPGKRCVCYACTVTRSNLRLSALAATVAR